MTAAAARARHLLWRGVLALTGGLTVRGALPSGGCVVVANHGSHADTAALLAALPPGRAPRFAAAADYWFDGGWRTRACRLLGAAFPVRRTGGGSADIAAAVQVLQTGGTVVVYPEGTRGDGVPAPFHTGAFRLAEAAGVPVVPVGLSGTAALLPKHGRIRRHRVRVTIGAAMRPDPRAARAEVARLAGHPVPPEPRPHRAEVARPAGRPVGEPA